ncbi:MAG: hypothetical protein ABWY93_31145 [Mycobacterium sp.]
MENGSAAKIRRAFVAFVAAVALSVSALFAGIPVGFADPYDDDGGDSGIEEPAIGDEPVQADEPAGGGVEEPADGDEPPGADQPTDAEQPADPEPPADEPTGDDEPTSGSEPATEDPAGGSEPATEEPAGDPVLDATGTGAADADVATALASEAAVTSSTVASSEELSSVRESIESTTSSSTSSTATLLSSSVTQWNSAWISYDTFYRPVFANPYQDPLLIIYTYNGQAQTFTVPPLQQAVIDLPQAGVYNFTGASRPASGKVSNVSVGSFSGGGYQPRPGQAPPTKPAALKTIKNALVQIKFQRGSSQPFRVGSLTDLGSDATVNGATKVLLDAEIPAWGQWSKNQKGEALFEITETQLLPGVNPPGQDPLPGYQVELAASDSAAPASWLRRNTVVIGVVVGVVVLAAVALTLMQRRRRSSAQ